MLLLLRLPKNLIVHVAYQANDQHSFFEVSSANNKYLFVSAPDSGGGSGGCGGQAAAGLIRSPY
jgi:hypothetical protein